MPTLAQVLQSAPEPADEPHFETVITATTATITTASGPIINATSLTPAAGKSVVVLRVEGVNVAIAALP